MTQYHCFQSYLGGQSSRPPPRFLRSPYLSLIVVVVIASVRFLFYRFCCSDKSARGAKQEIVMDNFHSTLSCLFTYAQRRNTLKTNIVIYLHLALVYLLIRSRGRGRGRQPPKLSERLSKMSTNRAKNCPSRAKIMLTNRLCVGQPPWVLSSRTLMVSTEEKYEFRFPSLF